MMLDTLSVVIILITTIVAFIRGAMKEILGIIGIVVSVILTINYSELLVEAFHFRSAIINFMISMVLVYLISFIAFSTLGGWIMHCLKPLCLSPMDRFFGVFVGVLKGLFLSYCAFLAIELTYYTFAHEDPDHSSNVPKWVTDAKMYPVFTYFEDLMNEMIPEEFYENMKDLGTDIQNSVQKKNAKDTDSKKTVGLFESAIED